MKKLIIISALGFSVTMFISKTCAMGIGRAQAKAQLLKRQDEKNAKRCVI